MAKTQGYAKRHGFRIANVPRNQTRLRAKYRYVMSGGAFGKGGRAYAKNMKEADKMMRMSVNTERIIRQRRGA